MANKNKGKPQVINNIQELNLEIDYDKLADAIVKAQEKAKDNQKRPNKFRAITMISINTTIPVMCILFSIIVCFTIWHEFVMSGTYPLFACIIATIVFALLITTNVLSAIEAWRDDDENAIMHFNTNVSLAALIIALIALFKEVG